MSLLLRFSGQIGSGKSSVSTEVAAALGWRRTGFGEYLRDEIARLGDDPNDRKALQNPGQQRVEDDSEAFCRDVLAAAGFQPGDEFATDGIRRVAIFEILAALADPSQARLLFLGASEKIRNTRVQIRGEASGLARASAHRVEAVLIDALPKRADGVVDSDQPLDRVARECLDLIQDWQRKPPQNLSIGVNREFTYL